MGKRKKGLAIRGGKPLDTVIGSGTRFEGTMKVGNSACIEGVFKGECFCAGSLTINPSGDVWADLEGQAVYIHGTVHGTVQAEKVQLDRQAGFIGDIYTRMLAIAAGAIFHGRSMPFEEDARDSPDPIAVVPQREVGSEAMR